jgi:hypothetical protein
LKEKLGYKVVESLWFYDPMNINGMVYLESLFPASSTQPAPTKKTTKKKKKGAAQQTQ